MYPRTYSKRGYTLFTRLTLAVVLAASHSHTGISIFTSKAFYLIEKVNIL